MADGQVLPGQLVKTFLKIKNRRAEILADFKEEDDKLKSQQETVKKALLAHCKEHDVESVRTSEGLCYRGVKTRYWTSDWESMYAFVREHDIPEFFEKRLNQGHVKQFLEENPESVPPGLNVDREYMISIRRN